MSISQSAKSLNAGRTLTGAEVIPISAGSEANGSMDAEQMLPKVEISGDSARQLTDALFVLWLKIAATLLAAWLVMHVWPVTILLILSLMVVATFNPIIRRMQQKVTRASAIALVVVAIMAVFSVMLVILVPPLLGQIKNLLLNLPHYLTQIEHDARSVGLKLRLHGSSVDLSQKAASVGPDTLNAVIVIFSGITGVLTVAVLSTYLLIDGQRVGTSIIGLLPRHQRLTFRQMFAEIGERVGAYVRGQLITSGLAGVFSFSLLAVVGVPEPLALGFLMAAADAIPLIGPLIGTIPAVMIALTKGTTVATIVLVGYIVYHQIESHILLPRVYGNAMKMSPSIVMIAIMIGATLMGIMGALLALPVAATIPILIRYVEQWRQRDEIEEINAEAASAK